MKTHVKICGITSLDDALFAAEAGVDFLGYIFYAPSKRFVAPRTAGDIIRNVRKQFPDIRHVGVFVDEEPHNVAWIRNLAGLDFVQLHGNETPDYCAGLDAIGVEAIKAIGIGPTGVRLDVLKYNTAFYLFDTHDENLKGGTGRKFDLNALPSSLETGRMFLAGGLNPDNVGELLSHIHPFAVDVSTGVEDSPGMKSRTKVKMFIDTVRTATANHSHQEQF